MSGRNPKLKPFVAIGLLSIVMVTAQCEADRIARTDAAGDGRAFVARAQDTDETCRLDIHVRRNGTRRCFAFRNVAPREASVLGR